ncbi:helix-turn-helix transcriptional regulator [Streptomyces meridianus]|uniref:Helix-turn-helix domain-containing protein n=1 Tax=Streptomyces meridianus TaxID=2938945 RepID=A0ABT0XAG8_9ACTN|nr:helix-turn-helix domain-containing protein [Streptomyces meridianus]MCM2579518.1 helix-turn-helix domain-containing protein [Streptomyces meridianus]
MTTATRLKPLSVDEVRALPAMPTLPQASAACGISRETGYELATRGEFPIPVIKLGRSLKVRHTDLLAFLGLENGDAVGAASPTASVERTTSTNK